MSVLIVGSVALDTIKTPLGKCKDVLGGSATYASMSASFFGPVSYHVQSGPTEVNVEVQVPDRSPPETLVVHLRRPKGQVLQSVKVNGATHGDFDPDDETVRIAAPSGKLTIQALYA